MTEDTGDDRVVRTVESLEEGAHVTLPDEWVGARVEVVRVGPGERDRAAYTLADADDAPAFASQDDGEPYAGEDVVEHLRLGAADPATFYLGLTADEAGAYHASVPRSALADGMAVVGADRRSALLCNLAWQAAAGGAGAAVFSRTGPTAERFARALPDDRAADLQVVGGPSGWSVNLLDPGVPPSSAAFFDAVDAVTDALVSVLVVAAPQLRDAVREFVMVAHGAQDDTTLVDLGELVRHGLDGADADVPAWVTEKSPDLLDRVEGVDEQAIEWFLDSLAPLVREPARSLLADPDPEVSLVDVVRSRDPLVVRVDDRYDVDTWRTVGRAVVGGLWAASREFVGDDVDNPFYLVCDEFEPVLDAVDDLGRLFARLHRDRVVPAVGVPDPAAVDAETWTELADAVATHATFGLSDGPALDRAAGLAGVDPEVVASLAAGRFRLGGADVEPDELLGYHPMPPERAADAWHP